MPGIAGYISVKPSKSCHETLNAMLASLKHEKFHRIDTYCVPSMGIYAGWVALESSFMSAQALQNETQDVALIFSGECYIDNTLKSELANKGHTIGENPGDWLVHLYEEKEERFFEKLNGLFSGLLIDLRKKKVYLFNDRYGVERLYCCEAVDGFYFASEAKAIMSVVPSTRKFDKEGLMQYLGFGCTFGNCTLFNKIEMLPGASLWQIGINDQIKKSIYFNIEDWEFQSKLDEDEFIEKFLETFVRILPRYFAGDFGIGISLTAGLDSRMIMACLPAAAVNPVCYTFSGNARETLDDIRASEVARSCGLNHYSLRIGPDFLSNFASHLDETVYLTDGYVGPMRAHEIYMNRQARELAPVRMTGVFGGEILRSVSTFGPRRLAPGLISQEHETEVNKCIDALSSGYLNPISQAIFREIPLMRFGPLKAGRSQTSFRSPFLDNELVALAYRAPKTVLS